MDMIIKEWDIHSSGCICWLQDCMVNHGEVVKNMGRNRKNDLKKAKEVLDALDLESTARLIEIMEEKVGERKGILWSEMQAFLNAFETDSKRRGATCKETFETMEKILLQALDDSNARTLSELQNRGLQAPEIDSYIDALEAGLSIVHNEVKASTRTQTGVLLLMLGHVVRWQVLEDFAKEWVGHWGRGLSHDLKKTGVELLLTVKYGAQTSSTLMADSRLYRNAIAHGG
jgi:hypothetical protein